jgi:hypothetical protein
VNGLYNCAHQEFAVLDSIGRRHKVPHVYMRLTLKRSNLVEDGDAREVLVSCVNLESMVLG